jgi:hypothetical protein
VWCYWEHLDKQGKRRGYGKLKYFTMQEHNLPKNPQKRNQNPSRFYNSTKDLNEQSNNNLLLKPSPFFNETNYSKTPEVHNGTSIYEGR